jgi:hypothetical protein
MISLTNDRFFFIQTLNLLCKYKGNILLIIYGNWKEGKSSYYFENSISFLILYN